jgi:very-short-patch-repair endonuclease
MFTPPFDTDPALWEKLKPLAREMRHAPTPAENIMWHQIRNRQRQKAKFRRQYSIERFIVDFCCLEARLIIEIDGEIHQYRQQQDQVRQAYLESRGFTVLRFTNNDVLQRLKTVLAKIDAHLGTGKVNEGK